MLSWRCFRKIRGAELKRDTAAYYYTSFYGRNFNCFQNWLYIIIFNLIFRKLRFWSKTTKFWRFLHIHLQYQRIWTIYGILAPESQFRSLGVDFELLGGNFGHLGVNFRPLENDFMVLGVDSEPLGVDICSQRVNLGPLGVDLGPLGVKFEPLAVDFWPPKIEFRFSQSILASWCRCWAASSQLWTPKSRFKSLGISSVCWFWA